MSYTSWHTYGYGICVSDITERSVERLQKLLAMAPYYQKMVQKWLDDREINEPSFDDYMDFDQDFHLGLASILESVICEADGFELVSCDSYDGKVYLLYCPSYPWYQSWSKQLATEEEARALFQKYISILTDEPIAISYQSVENGC